MYSTYLVPSLRVHHQQLGVVEDDSGLAARENGLVALVAVSVDGERLVSFLLSVASSLEVALVWGLEFRGFAVVHCGWL